MKRKRLYLHGILNSKGRDINEEVTKLLIEFVEKHPDVDLMDLERQIVHTAAYICTIKIARERGATRTQDKLLAKRSVGNARTKRR